MQGLCQKFLFPWVLAISCLVGILSDTYYRPSVWNLRSSVLTLLSQVADKTMMNLANVRVVRKHDHFVEMGFPVLKN